MLEADDKILKLMRYALNNSATDAESRNAWERCREEIIRRGLQAEDVVCASGDSEMVIVETVPGEMDMVIPFGKYRGQSIGWIFKNDACYLDWLDKSADKLSPVLKSAVRKVIATYGTFH